MRCSGCIERWRVCTIACEWHVASQPDARMKKILEEAANVGAATVCTRAARPREDMFSFYPGTGVWSTPFPGGSHEFLEDGARVLDARAYFQFYATGITPAADSRSASFEESPEHEDAKL